MIERFANNGGLRIRYLDNGGSADAGLPIVFVPGITDFADDYTEALSFVDPRRMVVVEMRGRGGSDSPPSGYSVAEQATDVEAVIADAGIERFHLMTFSRGTTPSFEVAFRDPSRVVTLSIGDYLAKEIGLPETYVETQWATRWRGRPTSERVQRHVLAGIQSQSQDRELWDEIGRLGIPVQVARGDAGGIVGDDAVDRYLRTVPGVEIVVISGAGHDLFRPDRVAYPKAVLDFIGRRAPNT